MANNPKGGGGRRRGQMPRYAAAVLAVAQRALADGTIRPGMVIPVMHDGWCALINGKGPCDCEPEVGPPERVPLRGRGRG